ncbi:MAG: hypothetical protein J2P19_01065 [Pseudonocardia sp.]|nr:hypothetical protein [Pseudonocardia sp.]
MQLCPPGGTFCHSLDPGKVGLSIGSSAFDRIVKAAEEAFAKMFEFVFTQWLYVGANLGNGHGSALVWAQQQMSWVIGAAGVAALIVGGVRIAFAREKGAMSVGRGILLLIVTTTVTVPSVVALNAAGDQWSTYMLNNAATVKAGAGIAALHAELGPFVTFLLCLIGVISAILQILMLMVRAAMLILISATLPVMGAASASQAGYNAVTKLVGWLVAALAYKPAAALVYMVAFRLLGTDVGQTGLGGRISEHLVGVVMVIMAVLMLPALMKVCVPMVARVTSNASGGPIVVAAAAAVADGALKLLMNRSDKSSKIQRDEKSSQVGAPPTPPPPPDGGGPDGGGSPPPPGGGQRQGAPSKGGKGSGVVDGVAKATGPVGAGAKTVVDAGAAVIKEGANQVHKAAHESTGADK